MRRFIAEYGYLAVMTVCLVCCAVLLVSVTTDRPLVAAAETHIPVLRTQTARTEEEHAPESAPEMSGEGSAAQETLSGPGAGYMLTEEYLETALADFLPECFPAADLDVDLEDGLMELSFTMSRGALKDYLKSRGAELSLRQSLFLQMLPRQLEAEAAFALSADEGGLHLAPVTLEVGDRAFDLSGLPADVFSAVDEGLNALLQSAGVSFSSAEFTNEGLLLK